MVLFFVLSTCVLSYLFTVTVTGNYYRCYVRTAVLVFYVFCFANFFLHTFFLFFLFSRFFFVAFFLFRLLLLVGIPGAYFVVHRSFELFFLFFFNMSRFAHIIPADVWDAPESQNSKC